MTKKKTFKELLDRSSLGTDDVKELAATVSDEDVAKCLALADDISKSRPRITHVAIKFRGVTYSLPAPNRHHHVIALIVKETGVSHVDNMQQGFLDEAGNYLNRTQALARALLHKQHKNPNDIRAKQLFSEDVW
jgi:hypothetical protein